MSVVLRCVALASLASVTVVSETYPNEAFKYLADTENVIKVHKDQVKFLKAVMLVDYLWSPVLNEMVRVKRPTKRADHYADNAPQQYEDTELLPLDIISALIASNTFTGTDVKLAMSVFRTALACSVLKHVSVESVMIHRLLTEFSDQTQDDEKKQMVGWLEHMIQLSINKLAAVDQPLPLVTQMRLYVAELLLLLDTKRDGPLKVDGLNEIGTEMYTELDKMCVVPVADEGHYGELIKDLNRTQTIDELVSHRTLFTDSMRGASRVKDVEIMQQYSGIIEIDSKIDLNGVSNLNMDVLKRATAANYIQMDFWFMNFPIQTLAESQWVTLSKLRKYDVLEAQTPADPAPIPEST